MSPDHILEAVLAAYIALLTWLNCGLLRDMTLCARMVKRLKADMDKRPFKGPGGRFVSPKANKQKRVEADLRAAAERAKAVEG